jgi:hypothetical protein
MKQIIFITIAALILSFPAFSQNVGAQCAAITVSGGGVVEEGDPMSFSADVKGLTKNSRLEYEWKVSNGTITSGQGTAEIKIDTTGLANQTEIKAEVVVRGLDDNCLKTAAETGSVSKTVCGGRPSDEFGNIANNEVKVRTDNLFITLQNSKNVQLYIVNYGTDKEIAAREKLIRKHIDSKKFDASRLTFIKGGANPRGESGIWTRAFLLPPDTPLSWFIL